MEKKKKDLAKQFLATLLLVSSLPAAVNATEETEATGTVLVGGGCSASSRGCGASFSCGAATTPNAGTTNPYGTSNQTYNPTNRPNSNYNYDPSGMNTGSYNRPGSSYDAMGGTYNSPSGYNRPGSSSDYSPGSSYQGTPGQDSYPQSQRGSYNNPNTGGWERR